MAGGDGGAGGWQVRPWTGGGLGGEVARWPGLVDPAPELERVCDPAAALETVHWGRNYLYATLLETPSGPLEVVVKQFRNQGWRRRWERRLRGSKAARSWRVAAALMAAGIATPRPVALVESSAPAGPSFLVTEKLVGAFEVRHFFRRLNGDEPAGDFPAVEPLAFLAELGGMARRLHDAGIVYRDLSLGNILVRPGADGLELYLVDLNRARTGQRPGAWRRTRDICRLPVLERPHREAFLRGYWGLVPRRLDLRWWLYSVSVAGYRAKHALKNRLRKLRPGRHGHGGMHHPHIPPAAAGAAARDRAVWDRLSDQPHQHAGRWHKLAIRLADAPSHVADLALVLGAAPEVRRRYRALKTEIGARPVRFDGIGVAVRPDPGDPDGHLAALLGLGVRSVLLRLHPWEDEHRDEERLAAALAGRGVEVSFALPQSRELVRDRGRWRAKVAELGERFRPYGRAFQVGQAVNRSKWGVWTSAEYLRLYRDAAEELRRLPEVELLGPAVIDFELQSVLALVRRQPPGVHFDIVSSLLYVDRRGPPEARQLGFDTVDKVILLKAIAESGRCCSGRCWITEVNWPLWEGPHSPAGRTVSVDEESQADYLVRYYALVLGTGMVERVFWWRLLARGYGLAVREPDGRLRTRPAYAALATLQRQVAGATLVGRRPAPAGAFLLELADDAGRVVLGWSVTPGVRVDLGARLDEVVERDGAPGPLPAGSEVVLGPSPRYFRLAGTS